MTVQSVSLLTTAESHVTAVHAVTLQTRTPSADASFCRLPAIPSSLPHSAPAHSLILELIDLRSEWEQKLCSVCECVCVCDLDARQPRISEKRLQHGKVRDDVRERERESEAARCICGRTLSIIYEAGAGPVLTELDHVS